MGSGQLATATSSSLLEGVKALDSQAWQRLVELYGPLVYRWCRRSQVRAEDAKDIVQEVFSAVATHIGGFHQHEGGGGFRAWLFTITRNKIRDFFRRCGNDPLASGGTEAYERLQRLPGESATDEAASANRADNILLVRRAVRLVRQEFAERTWEMYCRVTTLDEKPAEVAARFGVSVTAVYQAKSRVLRRLREVLDELPL
jgi:RNA polymerase sigma-70 factor, ECF subfamily